MKYRKLRIACSLACAIFCVLLSVLWARSYRYYDAVSYNFSTKAPETCWCDGVLHVGLKKNIIPVEEEGPLTVLTHRIGRMEHWKNEFEYQHMNSLGFGLINDSVEFALIAPFWCLWIVSGICALLLWPAKTWRFTLRNMLIATTLITSVLGLAVYAARK